MTNYLLTEDGGIILPPILAESAVEEIEFDFVTPFFTNNPFAISAVFAPAGGKAVEILTIFDAPYSTANPAGVSFDSASPSCLCMTADVADVTDGDSIYISNVEYFIKSIHPDGTGLTTLILSKDPIQ